MVWFTFKVQIILLLACPMIIPSTNAEFDSMEFWRKRNNLIDEEKSLAFGGKTPFYSESEIRANDILMKHKSSEINEAFFNSSEFAPSRNFMSVRKSIEDSNVFKIIRKMPKGAVLNVHASALVSAKWVYENVTFRDNVYICIRPEKLLLRIFDKPSNDCNWQLLSDLRNANETARTQINSRILRQLTLGTEGQAESYSSEDDLWAKFKKVFDLRVPLLRYKPLFEDYLYQGLKELYDDNVFFLEVRTPLLEMYDLDGKTYDEKESTEVYINVTNRFMRDHPDFMGVKIIYSIYRKMISSNLTETIKKIIQLQQIYPNVIAGIDLIGQEDLGYPLRNWISVLEPFINKTDFYFHAGETNWYGLESDENLFDAVLLNSKRIGHGYAIVKHPKIMELIKQKRMAVEVCPIANQVLALITDLRNHPASILFAQNFSIVISSNDPGVWGATALSYDFYEAFMGLMSNHSDIRALKQLAINSIHFSSMNQGQKARAVEIWVQKWKDFVDMV
ncbi:adenosine deaminase 2-like [Cotesia glomerata]|uniref:Adenosine deaminase n=1 Tax=Cotesia glomerata TaxID=32391 RepID=A0AAV7ISN6_COTGL|nr:adenosine deaminase 2-like [Cotesia glomerata]KAH0557346.1 hypothetical protein KQX54_004430 [Cotesia glomerata]